MLTFPSSSESFSSVVGVVRGLPISSSTPLLEATALLVLIGVGRLFGVAARLVVESKLTSLLLEMVFHLFGVEENLLEVLTSGVGERSYC